MSLLLIGSFERSDYLLNEVLTNAGLRRQDLDIVDLGRREGSDDAQRLHLRMALRRSVHPKVVVAAGKAAAGAFIGSTRVVQQRGYVWQAADCSEGSIGRTYLGESVALLTFDPGDCAVNRDSSGINRVLLEADLRRAKALVEAPEPFQRPTRRVTIVDRWKAVETASLLLKAPLLVCDLEAFDSEEASCIGFATSPSQAYVFPPPVFEAAKKVLAEHPSLCFQNGGTYDKYMVETRLGVRLRGYRHDTIVQWHTLYPEIAGSAKDSDGKQKGTKQTQKGLHFLASLYTYDRWWKDYAFASAEEEWALNGKDCCITYDCFLQMAEELRSGDLWALYLRQMELTFILDDVRQRGLAVDNGLRIERLEMLEGANKDATMKLENLLAPLLHARRDRLEKEHLFFKTKACGCCGNGKAKKAECWSCAGFEKKPGKKLLEASGKVLEPCAACGGQGQEEHFLGFNPGSGDQVKDILYNILKMPKRYKDGSLTTDEEALRGLLKEVVG